MHSVYNEKQLFKAWRGLGGGGGLSYAKQLTDSVKVEGHKEEEPEQPTTQTIRRRKET